MIRSAPQSEIPRQTYEGTIKDVLASQGFGFVKRDDGKPNVYFHRLDLAETLLWDKSLRGQRVRFEIVESKKARGQRRSAKGRVNEIRPAAANPAFSLSRETREQEYMGRGPKDIHAHLIGDLLVVRLKGVLTAAEQHLPAADRFPCGSGFLPTASGCRQLLAASAAIHCQMSPGMVGHSV